MPYILQAEEVHGTSYLYKQAKGAVGKRLVSALIGQGLVLTMALAKDDATGGAAGAAAPSTES